MGIYTGYFDEGGNELSFPFLMGGLVIDAENAQEFDDDWREAIKELPIHSDGYPRLHTTDFINGSEEFADAWKGRYEDKLRILTDAAGIIRKHSFRVFTCDLKMADYRNLDLEWKISECLGHPYGLVARAAMDQLKGWAMRSGMPVQPMMVIEKRCGIGEVTDLFIADGLSPPQHGGKENCALQAADYIAFMRLSKLRPTPSSERIRASWGEICQSLYDHLDIGKREILRICERLEAVTGQPIPTRSDGVGVKYHTQMKRPRYRFK